MARVAAAFGVTARTVRKWRDRHATGGEAAPRDRNSRPHASPRRLGGVARAGILALRRQRPTGPASVRRQAGATVGQVLHRHRSCVPLAARQGLGPCQPCLP